jgi:hypothetical protein
MLHYRAFQIDPSGRVLDCIHLVCDGDEDAKRRAARLVPRHRIELWRLDKRVARFDAPAKAASLDASLAQPDRARGPQPAMTPGLAAL